MTNLSHMFCLSSTRTDYNPNMPRLRVLTFRSRILMFNSKITHYTSACIKFLAAYFLLIFKPL